MGGLPSPLEAADIWRGIWFEEAHHSTAIEGNTLVLKQVEALLAEGRAVGDKALREYLESATPRPSSTSASAVTTCEPCDEPMPATPGNLASSSPAPSSTTSTGSSSPPSLVQPG